MADRVSVTIRIGGTLPHRLLCDLDAAVRREGAGIDWDGTPFVAADLVPGAPLTFMACEVAWGRFEEIEEFCFAHGLPFVRWAGGCPGSFDPERMIHRGDGATETFAVTDDDEVVITRNDVRRLGTIEAIEAHFAAAAFEPPPFTIVGAPGNT